MVIIPGTIQQHDGERLVFMPVLWIDGRLTKLGGEEARKSTLAASRAAWAHARSLYAAQRTSRSVLVRSFRKGEEEKLMEGALV